MISTRLIKNSVSMDSPEELEIHDNQYWRTGSTSERLEAIELMRQINFGNDPSSERLQRFFTIAQRA